MSTDSACTAQQPRCPECHTEGWHSSLNPSERVFECGTRWSSERTAQTRACQVIAGLRNELMQRGLREVA